MKSIIFTVHQLNEYVRILLSRDPILQKIRVRGEISNFKFHSSGHMYFTLKDDQDRIQCVFFKQRNYSLNYVPVDGMRVIVSGMVSLYTRDGQYQLYVDEMERDGLGELYLKFEALKKKLAQEGLFDTIYKKPLPLLPGKIAVITSHTGAAVRDIIRVARQRNKNIDIIVFPVAVQGQAAPEQIAKAIEYANTRDDIDLIITGRGGGSIEELWAFNEEIVARAIYRSKIPVISAVGHETDFTIADFVADLRAATPSNAAELAVPETSYMLSVVEGMKKGLIDNMNGYLTEKRHQLERLKNHYVFQMPRLILDQQNQYLDNLSQRLVYAVQAGISKKEDKISRLASSLHALSPLNVLARGYAITMSAEQDEIIRSISQLSPKYNISVRLIDGRAVCRVEEIKPLETD